MVSLGLTLGDNPSLPWAVLCGFSYTKEPKMGGGSEYSGAEITGSLVVFPSPNWGFEARPSTSTLPVLSWIPVSLSCIRDKA